MGQNLKADAPVGDDEDGQGSAPNADDPVAEDGSELLADLEVPDERGDQVTGGDDTGPRGYGYLDG